MVAAWYMSDIEGRDQREPLHLDPHEPLDMKQLEEIGVVYWKIDADNYEVEGKLDKICADRNYNYKDIIEINEKLPEYEKKLAMFFEEHLHLDEEIRFIMSGSGYFDIRAKDERWIRIEMTKGDLIVLPAGSYHRFTLDTKNYVKAMRLFIGEPVWTPYNRPTADDFPVRKEYLSSLQS